MEKRTVSRGRRVWVALLLLILLTNAGFTVARAVDAVSAHTGGLPRFSLLLPMWLEPQSRIAELVVLAAMPGLSFLLPLLAAAIGIVDFMRERQSDGSCTWSKILIGVAAVCLLSNAFTTYVIYRAVPSFQSALATLYISCPGWL